MKSSGVTFYRNNKAQLIRGGHDYFHLLEKLIDGAEQTIHLQTYIFDDDSTGTIISEALLRAARRGVKVFVLLDAYGSQGLSDDIVDRWKAAGIFVRKFRTLLKTKRFYLGRRLHHKVFIADGCKATVGGINISDRYNDMPEQRAWLDWALFVEGDVVGALEDVCKKRLRLKKKFPVQRREVVENVCQIAVRINDWVRRKRQIYRGYLQMLDDASSEIIIMSAYFLPGHQFRSRLLRARKRGVDIKIVVTGFSDVPLIKAAERYMYTRLLTSGIRVFEYHKNVLHAKLAMRDGEWLSVGSYNVNNLSAFASVELNLEVQDAAFVQSARERIEGIISEECHEVTEESFCRKRTIFQRFANKFAYEIYRFLFLISTRQRGDR